MIYLVTENQSLENPRYKIITVEESLDILKDWKLVQFDTETSGIDPHIAQLLCAQFGNKEDQIVVDCLTIDILNYKNILQDKFIIGQNLKFDIQFLYNYEIIPKRVYDTMIVEQLLYLGYPKGMISFSLAAIADRRLKIDIDKSIRGQIIWRGLDPDVVEYAANDVKFLEDIMWSQVNDCKEKNCLIGAKLECTFVPVIAYLEWCGIKLDEEGWKKKMKNDQENLDKAINDLTQFVIEEPRLQEFISIQGDLFTGFNNKVLINWSSSEQVVNVAKKLGFNTKTADKQTGEEKDSVLEKVLKIQKGINDKFLELYFKYQEYAKVVSSFGQSQLNYVNPNTGRIHTTYKQLGAASGRMSCGSRQPNKELAALKHIPTADCTPVNMQQLPANDETRSCFICEKGNKFVSCDFSALESRLGADIYEEKEMLHEFLEGSGDMHSLCAKLVFHKELEGIDVKDVKKLRPDLRKKVKGIELDEGAPRTEMYV